MTCELRVCQGGVCGPDGGFALLHDIEDLCAGRADVLPWSCLGHCGAGPNIEVCHNGKPPSVAEGVKTYSDMEELVSKHVPDLKARPLLTRVSKIKFKARREEDLQKRLVLLEEALGILKVETGDSAQSREPSALSQLLVARSHAMLRSNLDAALQDAEQAVALTPHNAFACEAFAAALERVGRLTKAKQVLAVALETSKGLTKQSLNRMFKRIERKLATSEKEEAHEAPKPKTVVDIDSLTPAPPADSVSGQASKKLLEDIDCASASVKSLWRIVHVAWANHNCLKIRLMSKGGSKQANDLSHIMYDTWHVDVQAEVNGAWVSRPYTPLSTLDTFYGGSVDLLVKTYAHGKMSQHLASLKPGSTISLCGPQATLDTSSYDCVLVVAGGSAVTVALQVCAAVLKRTFGSAPVHLILCNQSVKDVLCQDRFDALQKVCPTFHITHCIDQGEVQGMSDSEGRCVWRSGPLDPAALASVKPRTPAVVSGPPGLCRAAVDLLSSHGWNLEDIHVMDALPPAGGTIPIARTGGCEAVCVEHDSVSSSSFNLWDEIKRIVSCRRRRDRNLLSHDAALDPELADSQVGAAG